jgi:hypothetical protein
MDDGSGMLGIVFNFDDDLGTCDDTSHVPPSTDSERSARLDTSGAGVAMHLSIDESSLSPSALQINRPTNLIVDECVNE